MPAGAGSPYAAVAHAAAAYAAAAAAASAAISDQGPKPIFHAFQWSCRFLTWPELYVEKGHCLPEAWGTWIRCMENGLWAEHAGVQYILQDLVYSIRPVPVEEEREPQLWPTGLQPLLPPLLPRSSQCSRGTA